MSIGKRVVVELAALFVLCLTQAVWAQTDAGTGALDANARLAKLEQQAADAKSSADNAWMLTSAAPC